MTVIGAVRNLFFAAHRAKALRHKGLKVFSWATGARGEPPQSLEPQRVVPFTAHRVVGQVCIRLVLSLVELF